MKTFNKINGFVMEVEVSNFSPEYREEYQHFDTNGRGKFATDFEVEGYETVGSYESLNAAVAAYREEYLRTFINLTPHEVRLNTGETFPPSGTVARVGVEYSDFNSMGIATQEYDEVENIPEPKEGVFYIVSAMVLSASDREDLVAPATGHSNVIRNDKGQIVSVPGFVR